MFFSPILKTDISFERTLTGGLFESVLLEPVFFKQISNDSRARSGRWGGGARAGLGVEGISVPVP